MDYADRDWRGTLIVPLQSRVRELSEKLTKRYRLALPKESVSRKIRSSVLLLMAIGFGLFAHRLNNREAEILWRSTHRPSSQIWRTSFAAEGFRSLSNPTLQGRISRTLPSLTDSSGRIWSGSPDWWAVESADGGAPLIFCLGCDLKTAPKSWNSKGSGWDGWELALREAHQQATDRAKNEKKTKKPLIWLDPREIRY